MELKKVTYFLRIAEFGSLSRAAQSLYLTQPTLSRFLENLEAEAGVRLFLRSKGSALELTEAGKIYQKRARQAQQLWHQLDEELEPFREPAAPARIRFGIDGDFLQPFAAACAQAVMEKFPGVTVGFSSDGSQQIRQMLLDGQIVMGICAFRQKDPRLEYRFCRRSPIDLVVSPQHPLAAHAYSLPGQQDHRLSLHALAPGAPIALLRGGTVMHQTVLAYMQRQHYEPEVKQTYMRHGSVVSVLNAEPELIGFCPRNNTSGRLAFIALDPPFYYTRGICYLKTTALTPAEKYLLSLLKKFSDHRDLDG